MEQVRQGVFETNSSSTHSLTMCMDSDYQKWKNGELIYDYENAKLVPFTEEIKRKREEGDSEEYLAYEEFNDWSFLDYETVKKEFKTPSGEKIVCFGYFGYDG